MSIFKSKKKQNEKQTYHVVQNIAFLLKGMKTYHPVLILMLAAEIILSVVFPVFGIYIPKIALDLVLEGASFSRILLLLGGVGLLMTLASAFSHAAEQGKYMLSNDMRSYYTDMLFYQSLSCDYKNIESEEGQTKFRRAMETLYYGDWSGTSVMTMATKDILISILCFIVYSGIMANLSPWMVLILVGLSLINLLGTRRAQQYEEQHKDDEARIQKKLRYIESAGSSAKFGKDMRLYQTGGWFKSLREDLLRQTISLGNRIQNHYFGAGALNAFLLFLRDGIAYAYLIYAVVSGKITISEFTLYFGAISAFSGFVSGIVDNLNNLNGANIQMNSMRAFLDTTDEPQPEHPVPLSAIKDNTIEFRDVCFQYPKDERPILDHFNLTIHAGEKVALVGTNGAGKTTTVKLLCGFYRPDSGQILVGGQDITNLRKEDRLKLIAAVFQDIYIPPFTVAENVALHENPDRKRVQDCLTKVGLWEKISSYEKGMDTEMTHEVFEDGITLSGGQQQKLLMARALYKNAPILILDEPTAALDPIAESETYEQFCVVTKGDNGREKTALYISHRLASTRFCDKIALIDGGRVIEEGTHEQLLALGGKYNEMFMVQSQYYQSKEDGSDDEI